MERKERVAYFADEKKRLEMRSAGYYPVPVKLSWSWDGGGAPEFQIRVSTSRDLEKGSRLTATKTLCSVPSLPCPSSGELSRIAV